LNAEDVAVVIELIERRGSGPGIRRKLVCEVDALRMSALGRIDVHLRDFAGAIDAGGDDPSSIKDNVKLRS
jgi:hypothetical protein